MNLSENILAILCVVFTTSCSDAFVCPSTASVYNGGSHGGVVSALHASANEETVVERCYDAWNRRKMSDAAAFFAALLTTMTGSISDPSTRNHILKDYSSELPSSPVKCSNGGRSHCQMPYLR